MSALLVTVNSNPFSKCGLMSDFQNCINSKWLACRTLHLLSDVIIAVSKVFYQQ